MVVICTDGLANVGLGSMEVENEETEKFYEKLTEIAKDRGISVSVITIKGEECKMKVIL
jgi:hypothetical protein